MKDADVYIELVSRISMNREENGLEQGSRSEKT